MSDDNIKDIMTRFCKQCIHWNRYLSMPGTPPVNFGTCTQGKQHVTKNGDDWCRHHLFKGEATRDNVKYL